MTPSSMAKHLTQIVAEVTGSIGAWRDAEVTEHEMYQIRAKAEMFLRAKHTEAVDREIDARRRMRIGDMGR
jgi:hypothetical protein